MRNISPRSYQDLLSTVTDIMERDGSLMAVCCIVDDVKTDFISKICSAKMADESIVIMEMNDVTRELISELISIGRLDRRADPSIPDTVTKRTIPIAMIFLKNQGMYSKFEAHENIPQQIEKARGYKFRL